MNYLEIKHLRMVRAISDTGNMTRAAERLHITQSALSQQLKDIEGKLQTPLFFRAPKKMVLTPVGKNLLKTAAHVIESLEEAELEIAKLVSGEQGELKVGAHCVFCYKWLPGVMQAFQSKFPNIDFEIGNACDVPREIETERYHIVITILELPEERFTCLPLFSDQMVCAMPNGHPLSAQPFLKAEHFNGYSLISHAEIERNRFYQAFLKPEGVKPKKMMTVGPPQAIIDLVASGLGISVFPKWAIREAFEGRRITVRPITRNGLQVTWKAAFLKNEQMPVFQQEFIRIIRFPQTPSGSGRRTGYFSPRTP
jgi:LysR family transcriptional regulator for metE and metH